MFDEDLPEDAEIIGEPVYIGNDDKWVQKYVVEDIFHEESHTALDSHGGTTTKERKKRCVNCGVIHPLEVVARVGE